MNSSSSHIWAFLSLPNKRFQEAGGQEKRMESGIISKAKEHLQWGMWFVGWDPPLWPAPHSKLWGFLCFKSRVRMRDQVSGKISPYTLPNSKPSGKPWIWDREWYISPGYQSKDRVYGLRLLFTVLELQFTVTHLEWCVTVKPLFPGGGERGRLKCMQTIYDHALSTFRVLVKLVPMHWDCLCLCWCLLVSMYDVKQAKDRIHTQFIYLQL